MTDSQEGQLEHVHLQGTAVVCNIWEKQLERRYLLHVYMTALNCCVDGTAADRMCSDCSSWL